ncbi:4-alpha-glucanotransferase [Pseudoruegeria sp. SK021]|uniref:4-alpha-glucanotransferase n=1 Tax=Pseudoruegeria sp. SK021 TaxID=1933035 RepID=UPI000A21A6A8|nr:4-alpha-glucanotransferase [Pseudoruegeria sp. SK021]OSP53751.1 4-alpha-glucanotransferase [Pseudoruegeria sp. SK021]
MTNTLTDLAHRAGIVARYTDATGKVHDTNPDTQLALLTAMGVLPSGTADADSALTRLEAAAAARPLPEWIVTEAGAPLTLHPARPGGDWSLTLEDGQVLTGQAGSDLSLPPLPLGIHDLWLEGACTTVLSAPASLPEPPMGWGVTLPLYGLRPQDQGGLGSYADLAQAVRGLGAHGADFVGINPVHAGFPDDVLAFSPYAPSSRRRFSTAHIATDEARVPDAALIDYAAVLPRHTDALRRSFAARAADPAFSAYRAAEGDDLTRFALHQALSDRFGPYWPNWPEAYQHPDSPEVAAFAAEHADAVTFHAWLQFQAETQLTGVRDAARDAGMHYGLYLDLAVGTHPFGAETWAAPDLFARGVSLGAPPDAFAADGQMWNLAPLNPVALAKAGFRPLARILRAQLRFSSLLRIDHILGFDRAFWVPEAAGVPGAYVTMPKAALLAVVRIEAARAGATIIGEDLGNIPDGLQADLAASGILGCRVIMFEQTHDPQTPAFHPAAAYARRALTSFATHDLPTWQGWRSGLDIDWRRDLGSITPEHAAQALQDRARQVSALDQRLAAGTADVSALHQFLASTASRLVAVQIEDILGLEQQPNLPGTVFDHPNWRRRLPVGPADFATDARIRETAAIMAAAGRGGTAD